MQAISLLNLNMTNVEGKDVYVRVMDSAGRMVCYNRYVVDGSLNTTVVFENALSSGLYMVECVMGEKVITQRMMVQK